ncbi:DUF3304 domain-containing protein [Paraburkholderia terrae]|uniref:DUF3304 domain-containing protein n=1 Tax=Paraburkholderia terrae TaxID=311230 RepID=A0A2I8EYJ2_9BURK|nr:DUF3304 domain-containing protein [Paraburkholderia terrae]AUT64656.1 DUF3304 domain-containing protein [Paraburkholderia terrae]BDC44586.1 hypothetical protein PTKU15_78830 [Paraburkholderia terrae]
MKIDTGKRIVLAIFTAATPLLGCASLSQIGYVPEVAVFTANYTDKYVYYSLDDADDRPLNIGGSAHPFKNGGTGGTDCCRSMPDAGQKITVRWQEGTKDINADQTPLLHKTVIVRGSSPPSGDRFNYMIVRFFSGQQVEVEILSDPNGPRATRNPRRDQIFYGQRVMRKIGE